MPVRISCAILVCCFSGCWQGQPKNLEPAPLDPISATRQAMEEFDSDQDGKIDRSELANSPGLKAAVPKADRNKDGVLSEEEISKRLQFFVDSQSALRNFQLTVTVNRKPHDGLEVTLYPESFLASTIEPAVGTTNHLGIAYPMIQFDDPEIVKQGISGVRPGMYRVAVSMLDAKGKETIPSKYNTETQLGVEVGLDDHALPPTLNVLAR